MISEQLGSNAMTAMIVISLSSVIGVCVLVGMAFNHREVMKYGRSAYEVKRCTECKRPYEGEIEVMRSVNKIVNEQTDFGQGPGIAPLNATES